MASSRPEEIAAQIDDDAVGALRDRADSALEELRSVNAELFDAANEMRDTAAPDLPEADMDALEEAQEEARGAVLIDSDMSFSEATESIRSHNEMDVRRGK